MSEEAAELARAVEERGVVVQHQNTMINNFKTSALASFILLQISAIGLSQRTTRYLIPPNHRYGARFVSPNS